MSKKKIKQDKEILAESGDRNIDIFFSKDRTSTKIEYFYHSRRSMPIGSESHALPGYKLIEIRKYVLGVMYLWELK